MLSINKQCAKPVEINFAEHFRVGMYYKEVSFGCALKSSTKREVGDYLACDDEAENTGSSAVPRGGGTSILEVSSKSKT